MNNESNPNEEINKGIYSMEDALRNSKPMDPDNPPFRIHVPSGPVRTEPKENDRKTLPFEAGDSALNESPLSILNFPEFKGDQADINRPLADILRGAESGERIFGVKAEFLARYEKLAPNRTFNDWSFEDFGIKDPFPADRIHTSEVVALAHYPEAKVVKARVLFTFTERQDFGKYALDRFNKEELLAWANLTLDVAIRDSTGAHWRSRREPNWFILRGRVASIYVEPNYSAHHFYCRSREIQAFDDMP